MRYQQGWCDFFLGHQGILAQDRASDLDYHLNHGQIWECDPHGRCSPVSQ